MSKPSGYYAGPGLPAEGAESTYPVTKIDLDLIHDGLFNCLFTYKGTRFMEPEFGSLLGRLAFEPDDDIFDMLAELIIGDAVSQWEPRIVPGSFVFDHSKDNTIGTVVQFTAFVKRLGKDASFSYVIPRNRI